MPRPQKPGAPPPKRRSRTGCWNCKRKKIKCDETHPRCSNCARIGDECDYSVQLKWGGRQKRKEPDDPPGCGQQILSFDRPVMAETSLSPNPAGRPPPIQRPQSSPLPVLPPPAFLSFTAAQYAPALTLTPAQLPFVDDEHAFSLQTTLSGSPSFVVPTCAPSYAAIPASGGGINLDGVDSRKVLSFEASYQPPPIRPPRKRVKVEPSRLDLLAVLHMDSPALASDSAFATPRLNSLPSLFSGTGSTAPTPDRMNSPQSDCAGDGDEGRSEEDLMLMSPGLRRMSVPFFSMVTEDSLQDGTEMKVISIREHPSRVVSSEGYSSVRCWGIDRGFHDMDLGYNDDEHVLSGDFPITLNNQKYPVDVQIEPGDAPPAFAFGIRSSQDYYDGHVYVIIPESLSPLPDSLLHNNMNLLYFHHFLNHTARVLVPHDDPQSNPFRTVLPQMALKNDNLLSLLLAYSAAHRARYLGHAEPSLRIMTFVEGILPSLLDLVAKVVEDPETVISTADLATAIMMASLEIISPASLGVVEISEEFETSIPWQSHLRLAREIIAHRPGGLHRTRSEGQEDQACAFLWSWFAYLDVLGSLSGGRGQAGSHGRWILDCQSGDSAIGDETGEDNDDGDQIDCIMGFKPRCVYILAKVAELARTCDAARINPETNSLRLGWTPDSTTAVEAAKLREAVARSLAMPSRPCRHVHATTDVVKWDLDQMAATNEAYHWAALIHLHRRVLGLPSDHEDVRTPVGKILDCLEKIERGGTAETCLLFPMFTAGCELTDESARESILERVRTVEETGMTQVSGARKLMEKVWREGQPWETLLSTEFIG